MSDRLTTTPVFFPIPGFSQVAANELVLVLNELITELNAVLQSIGAASGGFATNRQLRLALANQGKLDTYNNLVTADPATTQNINWNHASTITVGDPLYNDIQTQLGYTNLQMTTLMALAQTFQP